MIHNFRSSGIVYDLARPFRIVQPIAEPSQKLPTLRICRNIPIDFFVKAVYNIIRGNRYLKPFRELDPSAYQEV